MVTIDTLELQALRELEGKFSESFEQMSRSYERLGDSFFVASREIKKTGKTLQYVALIQLQPDASFNGMRLWILKFRLKLIDYTTGWVKHWMNAKRDFPIELDSSRRAWEKEIRKIIQQG